MAAAGFRHSGKSRAKSTQGWFPNSGQVAEDATRNPDLVLASEQQQLSAIILALPQQQNQQAGTQTQSASSLDQPQNGLVQYRPTGNNPEPPTTDAMGQYQPAGNNETPLAGDDLNSSVIVNAQLTHLISRDDAAQEQNASNIPDVLMPDVPAVHDIATPRRTLCGRCRKWCISAQPPTGKRKCAACCMCEIRFIHGEARLQQWSNRQTNHHYVHAHCVNEGLGHDHELHVDAVTRQRDTITRTAADTEVLLPFVQDPDQASTAAPPDVMSGMKRSWTSSGLNTSHGTASKTCVARRMSNLPRGSGFRCSKPNMPFFEPSFTITQPLRPQSQLGKRWCSAAGSFWDDPQSTPLRATVHTFWMRDWSFFFGGGLVCSLGHGTRRT